MQVSVKQPLSNVQPPGGPVELLKTFSHQLSENELVELRKTLALFFAQRLIQQADKVWDEKNRTDQDVDKILNTKMRKTK